MDNNWNFEQIVDVLVLASFPAYTQCFPGETGVALIIDDHGRAGSYWGAWLSNTPDSKFISWHYHNGAWKTMLDVMDDIPGSPRKRRSGLVGYKPDPRWTKVYHDISYHDVAVASTQVLKVFKYLKLLEREQRCRIKRKQALNQ